MELMFDLYDKNDPFDHELVEVNKWNRKGGITYRNISELSRIPTNIILLKLILRELPICEDVHWYILGMMKFLNLYLRWTLRTGIIRDLFINLTVLKSCQKFISYITL